MSGALYLGGVMTGTLFDFTPLTSTHSQNLEQAYKPKMASYTADVCFEKYICLYGNSVIDSLGKNYFGIKRGEAFGCRRSLKNVFVFDGLSVCVCFPDSP